MKQRFNFVNVEGGVFHDVTPQLLEHDNTTGGDQAPVLM